MYRSDDAAPALARDQDGGSQVCEALALADDDSLPLATKQAQATLANIKAPAFAHRQTVSCDLTPLDCPSQALATATDQGSLKPSLSVSLDAVRKAITCQLCHELVASSLVMQCSHVFCGSCLFTHLNTKPQCPTCQVNLRAIPVRCPSLDSVSAAFVKSLDAKDQANFHARTEEGKAAANKLNKMFWWLQSPMAVCGPDAVGCGGMPMGGAPGSGMVPGGPGGYNMQQMGGGANSNPRAGYPPMVSAFQQQQQPGLFMGHGSMSPVPNYNMPSRFKPPAQGHHHQQLPPQHRQPGSGCFGNGQMGGADRIARPSLDNMQPQGSYNPLSGLNNPSMHRRNSEGSNVPAFPGSAPTKPGALQPDNNNNPGLSTRHSYTNGEPAAGGHNMMAGLHAGGSYAGLGGYGDMSGGQYGGAAPYMGLGELSSQQMSHEQAMVAVLQQMYLS